MASPARCGAKSATWRTLTTPVQASKPACACSNISRPAADAPLFNLKRFSFACTDDLSSEFSFSVDQPAERLIDGVVEGQHVPLLQIQQLANLQRRTFQMGFQSACGFAQQLQHPRLVGLSGFDFARGRLGRAVL